MKLVPTIPIVLIVLALTLANIRVSGADSARGRLLYESQCQDCHNRSVHVRKARAAQSYADIRKQVIRWSTVVGARWTSQEVSDVTQYLNSRYYQFDCKKKHCNEAHARRGADNARRTAATKAPLSRPIAPPPATTRSVSAIVSR